MAIIVRYLEQSHNPDEPPKAVERLLNVFTTHTTSGAALKASIMKTLNEYKISLENLVGQSFDGAGNMRGKLKGLKTLIQIDAPKAEYVWCNSHRFNLVVNAVCSSSLQLKRAIDILEELHTFMTGYKRNAAFIEEQGKGRKMSVKRVQTTRFSSTKDAVTTMLRMFTPVMSTLEKLSEDRELDNKTITEATGLLKRIRDINFVVCIHVLDKIFSVTSPMTIMLQGVAIDLASAAHLLENCKASISNLRENGDSSWEEMWQLSIRFAERHGIDPTKVQRKRKVPRKANELCGDEAPDDTQKRLKTGVYIVALDALINQMNDRFPDSNLALFRQMSVFTEKRLKSVPFTVKEEDIRHLCERYGFDAHEAIKELESFVSCYVDLDDDNQSNNSAAQTLSVSTGQQQQPYSQDSSSGTENESEDDGRGDSTQRETDEFIYKHWRQFGFFDPLRVVFQLSAFPTLTCIYKVLATLPVTSCSAERAMSRLKIIKNRLRSTTSDERLDSLMIIASESDVDSLQATDITGICRF
jgi:hypothetical protein